MKRVVLIRHGRSSHVHAGWIDRDGFLQWRELYEAAGIDDVPPDALRTRVGASGCVISSDTRRAIESARALAPDREIATSALLRELDLHPPRLRWLRLPMFGWALLYGVQSLKRFLLRQRTVSPAESERIDAAARWIEELAEAHGSVAVVTHATFRRRLALHLVGRGWRKEEWADGWRHWSAWSVTRK